MKIDAFIQLMSNIRKGQLTDDTDPNNTEIQQYTSPYDTVSNAESIVTLTAKTANRVWGDGKTYATTDQQGNTVNAPSCGWTWGAGGAWEASYKQIILNDNPIAYYRLDETSGTVAFDSSGNANHGTIAGGVMLGQTGALAGGDTAMNFNGSSTAYVQLPSATDISYPISVEGWAKPSSFGSGEGVYVIATDPGLRLRITSAGYPYSDIETGGSWHISATAPNPVPLNQWCHLVATYDGSKLVLYVNGYKAATLNVTGDITYNNSTPYVIGSDNYSGAAYHNNMNGFLDEIAIYPYILSDAQILKHYYAKDIPLS